MEMVLNDFEVLNQSEMEEIDGGAKLSTVAKATAAVTAALLGVYECGKAVGQAIKNIWG